MRAKFGKMICFDLLHTTYLWVFFLLFFLSNLGSRVSQAGLQYIHYLPANAAGSVEGDRAGRSGLWMIIKRPVDLLYAHFCCFLLCSSWPPSSTIVLLQKCEFFFTCHDDTIVHWIADLHTEIKHVAPDSLSLLWLRWLSKCWKDTQLCH